MDWRIKMIGERVASLMPGSMGHAIHRFAQRRYTRVEVGNDKQKRHEIQRAISTLSYAAEKTGLDYRGSRLLEVGTGWHGSDLVIMHLLGAETIYTCDLLPHLEAKLILWTLDGALERLEDIAEVCGDSVDTVRARAMALGKNKTLEALLKHANITYLAPCLFHETDLPEDFFDLFYSYSVLQRVPPHHLTQYLKIGRRSVKTGRYALHVFHHADHHARHDPKLNPLNYLKFGSAYDMLQSKQFNYQNRIRHGDFIELFKEAGFTTVSEETTTQDIESIKGMRLAKQYRHLPAEDLVITRTQLLSQAI